MWFGQSGTYRTSAFIVLALGSFESGPLEDRFQSATEAVGRSAIVSRARFRQHAASKMLLHQSHQNAIQRRANRGSLDEKRVAVFAGLEHPVYGSDVTLDARETATDLGSVGFGKVPGGRFRVSENRQIPRRGTG
jgi:hypothetical protein